MIPAHSNTVNLESQQPKFMDYRDFSLQQRKCHLNWHIKPLDRTGFQARLRLREFGCIVFSEVEHDPLLGTRSLSDINQKADSFVGLTHFSKGKMTFEQSGREVGLCSNDLLIWDGTRTGSIDSSEIIHCKTILFPRALVRHHIGNVENLTGQKMSLDPGKGSLLKSHLDTLHESVELISSDDFPSVIRATLELLSACFHPDQNTPDGTSYRQTLFKRIEDFMHANLLEPTLTPVTVANHLGFTSRYLHLLFAEAGCTFSEWVRRERLTRAERMLTNPRFASESITSIAHRFGFCDAAHFTNLFKAKFGVPPGAYRSKKKDDHSTNL